jgi:hypothetical protein
MYQIEFFVEKVFISKKGVIKNISREVILDCGPGYLF